MAHRRRRARPSTVPEIIATLLTLLCLPLLVPIVSHVTPLLLHIAVHGTLLDPSRPIHR